ncbi:MAG: hypothetical protein GY750_07090 [Lentisphaerae bacterium]|nr:hypothetical protein [Lentisphaerota bacterium]MCP4101176.1 hypothetical protein [Lentisphaerota bacterium]
MIGTSSADEYLQRHLKHGVWSSLDTDTKVSSLKMAEDDICLFLGRDSVDETRIFQVCAVYEQAVFLAENYDSLASGRVVQSEKIDGVGSATYKNDHEIAYGPRTLAFLNRECIGNQLTRG